MSDNSATSSVRNLQSQTLWLVIVTALLLISSAMATDLDDPMRPSTSRPQTLPTPPAEAPSRPAPPTRFVAGEHSLQEVYLLGQIRRARINNTWYEPGDRILNATVIDILPHAAVVEADDLYHMLYLNRDRAVFRSLKEAQ